MSKSTSKPSRNVLIVHPEYDRAANVGELVEHSGVAWEHWHALPEVAGSDQATDWQAVLVFESLFVSDGARSVTDLRTRFPEHVVLVGLVDSSTVDSPALFGAGVDLILYEPLVMADIERALAFAEAVHFESRRQARDRLRKMTALHELAVASGHRTGAQGWLDRLVDAGRQILGSDALAMWSIDRDHERLRCAGSSGLDESYIERAEQQSSLLLEGYEDLPRQLSTHWLTDHDTSSRFKLVVPEAARAVGITQIAWLPVRDSSRLYGHLSFYFMNNETFEKYDLVLADAFASIVAAALGTFWLQTEIRRTNRLYREHVESSPDGVVVCHPDGIVERSNPATEQITGRDQYEIIGQSVFDWFLAPDDLPWNDWLQLESDAPAETIDVWLSCKNGERRRVSCYARRVSFPDPRRLDESEHRIQLVLTDITVSARRLVELELFHDLTRLISDRGSLDEAYELVVSRLYNYLNYRLVTIGKVVGDSRLEMQAYRTNMVDVAIPSELEITYGLCGRAVRENRSLLIPEVRSHPEYFSIDDDVQSEIVAVIRSDGAPIGVIDIQSDATQPLDDGDLQLADSIAAHLGLLIEQVEVQERLERQALTDPLTGMANRRAFMRTLQALVNDPGSPSAALLLVELDRFKSVNDRFGHLFGDEMLKQVAGRLHKVLRERDVLARYGGDEIAMIFHDVTADGAVAIAERLRASISGAPFSYEGVTTDLTVSIGIALFPYHGRTTDELIGEADKAMYEAKLEGRNSVKGNVPRSDS